MTRKDQLSFNNNYIVKYLCLVIDQAWINKTRHAMPRVFQPKYKIPIVPIAYIDVYHFFMLLISCV